jgi:peroxiredoxin
MRKRYFFAALLVLLCGISLAGPDRDRAAMSPLPALPGTPEPVHPADFTLPALDGRPVALSRFLGEKPVLLVFFATWCPECEAAIPAINALHLGPLAGKVQILGVDYRESRKKVTAAVKARNILFPVLLDESGKVARAYGVAGIPTYILIRRDGNVAFRNFQLPGDISRYL